MKIDVYINNALKTELNNKVVGFEIIDNTGVRVDSLKLSINNAELQFDIPTNRDEDKPVELVINDVKMGIFFIEYVSHSSSLLVIEGASCNLKLARELHTRVFKDTSLKDVLTTLSAELDLSLKLDSELSNKAISYLVQNDTSNMRILDYLAEIYYCICNIKDKCLYFLPQNKKQEVITLTNEQEIISLYKVDNDLKIYKGVKASYYDFKEATLQEITQGESPYLIINENIELDLLKELVSSKCKELSREEEVNLVISGKMEVQSGMELEIALDSGIYIDFKGKYKIMQVIHDYEGGYYKSKVTLYRI